MATIYRHLLQLYPATHRRKYGDEMAEVFTELWTDLADQRPIARMRFYLREAGGVVRGAMQEHWHEFSIRRFSMHSEFRFPKMTWLLMTIILAGVVVAMEKGEAIQARLVDPAVGPMYPGRHTLVVGSFGLFLLVYAVGALVWVIVFALRRSRVHRLGDVTGEK